MERLINILLVFKEYVILVVLIIVSLLLLGGNDNRQLHAIRSTTIGAVGAMQNALSAIPNVFELRHENEVLRQINVNLSDEVNRLREARLENHRLRQLLDLKERSPLPLTAADVVGKSLHLLRNTLTLSAGAQDGIRPDMPIICETGLVGKILATSEHYSVGQLVLNKDFRASAKIQRSRVVGIIAWDGGDLLHLKNVSKSQDIKEGDVVLTSEYSNVFPRDVRIGTVARVSDKQGNLFKDVDVLPSVNFFTLEQVFIITEAADTVRGSLENRPVRTK
jgi:rod shape-determining protein MreC